MRCKFSHGENGSAGSGGESWESSGVPQGGQSSLAKYARKGGSSAAGQLGGAPGSKAASEMDDEELELQVTTLNIARRLGALIHCIFWLIHCCQKLGEQFI